jgi:hypothetical protein
MRDKFHSIIQNWKQEFRALQLLAFKFFMKLGNDENTLNDRISYQN